MSDESNSNDFPDSQQPSGFGWPYGNQSERTQASHGGISVEGEVGVADYYRRKPKRSTSTLVALAPHVLLLARCEGAPETAKYFSERLGVNVTVKMVKTLKAKVARGALVVTREELEAAAMSHAITAARMIREPAICDPQHYRAAITPDEEKPDADSVKKATVKAADKKAAAKSVERQKKATATKPAEVPPATGLKQNVSDEKLAEKLALVAKLKKEVRGE